MQRWWKAGNREGVPRAAFKALHCPLAPVNGTIYASAGRTHIQRQTDRHRQADRRTHTVARFCAPACVWEGGGGVCACLAYYEMNENEKQLMLKSRKKRKWKS